MKRVIILLFAVYLSGCAFPASKEGMIVTDYIAPKKIGEKIFVKESTGGSITLPFWKSNIPNDNFSEAVKESLLNSKVFSAQSFNWGDDWGLEIEIIDVDQPILGFNLTVTTNIKYSLYLKGKKVHETTIREPGTATFSESFIGIQRLRIANEFSAKANVKKFIAELPTVTYDQQTEK
jgi:hypothetical protein